MPASLRVDTSATGRGVIALSMQVNEEHSQR